MTRMLMTFWLLACLGLNAAGSASAQSLDEAKAAGQLGERADGYLGLVQPNAPANIQALMAEINEKRRARYAEIAASRGVTPDVVAKIAAKKVYDQAPAGAFFFDESGSWKRK